MIVQAAKYIELQSRLAAKAGKSKKEYKLSLLSGKTPEKVRNMAEAPIKDVFTDLSNGKMFLFSFSCFIIFND
jgi:polyribonucleotide nucleotidyltransferase